MSERQSEDAPIIGFVGPKIHFSNILLRNIAHEMTEFQALRFNSIEKFLNSVDHALCTTCLLVVDADHCNLHFDQCRQFHNTFTQQTNRSWAPGLAVSYFEKCQALNLMEQVQQLQYLRGFVSMNQSIEVVLSVIRLMAHGGTYLPPELIQPNEQGAAPSEGSDTDQTEPAATSGCAGALTRREAEVMKLVAGGMQNKQAASSLGISEHTIKLHMHHVIAKLGVRNRTEAATKYMSLLEK
ncbi:response regulator transcription factor [Rhodobacteraceae bacterium D3-12]|nr:response regulator transcription factor [Rhodobacteraceae bacterium D3-12]